MGLAFDLAEALNLLAGGAFGEGAGSLRARLEDKAVRRKLRKALRSDLTGLGILTRSETNSLVSFVVSDRFAALITDSADFENSETDELSRILSRLDREQEILVVRRIRQVALSALLRTTDLNDAVVVHMLRNIDEASLFLVNLGLDNRQMLTDLSELIESIHVSGVSPAPPAIRESIHSLQARSLLALTVSAAVREFGIVVRVDSDNRELIEWTGRALDMLVDDVESQVEQVLIVLHRSQYGRLYGSAHRIPIDSILAANRRLQTLSADARTIAEALARVETLPPAVLRLVEMTATIAIAEDFLVLRLHNLDGIAEVDDNLGSPMFSSELGSSTIVELTAALQQLSALRLDLRRAVAEVIPQI